LHSQLAAGLQAVVHLERPGGAVRVVREIGCLQRDADGLALVVPALRVGQDGLLVEGPAAGVLSALLDGSGTG
jgi:hypothetical protein